MTKDVKSRGGMDCRRCSSGVEWVADAESRLKSSVCNSRFSFVGDEITMTDISVPTTQKGKDNS